MVVRAQEIKLSNDSGGGTDFIRTNDKVREKGKGATVCEWNHHSFAHRLELRHTYVRRGDLLQLKGSGRVKARATACIAFARRGASSG